MKISFRSVLGLLALALLPTVAARAEVRLAPLFTDHAVLQRDQPVPIWGTAEVGEKIAVTFGRQHREATAGHDGHWLVIQDPLPPTTVGSTLTVAGRNTNNLSD
jgi:sialate O-acetylesterase